MKEASVLVVSSLKDERVLTTAKVSVFRIGSKGR